MAARALFGFMLYRLYAAETAIEQQKENIAGVCGSKCLKCRFKLSHLESTHLHLDSLVVFGYDAALCSQIQVFKTLERRKVLYVDAATQGLSGTQAQPLHQGGCVKLAHLSAKGSCVDAKGQPVHCSELLFLHGISHIVRLWNKLRWSNLMPTWLNNLADRKDCEMAHFESALHTRNSAPSITQACCGLRNEGVSAKGCCSNACIICHFRSFLCLGRRRNVTPILQSPLLKLSK